MSERADEASPVLLVGVAMVSRDGFISTGRGVPWDLPVDRAHFRAVTAGKALLVGRRTFEEMQGWFQPGHWPLVLTRRPLGAAVGEAVSGVEEARDRVAQRGGGELWVIGGAAAYAAAMPQMQVMWLTRVEAELGEGVRFPGWVQADWRRVRSERHGVDASHPVAFSIEQWVRSGA
ncbi:MAG: dihydrofolate reductase [Verrucomicrobiales bacterium]|nr:dihydrofolate reductase [Verrucomicrobiales bacterium]